MRFQSAYPKAADVLAASREELAIGMLPVLAGWETGYALSLEELISRVCGDGNIAFPLARYDSHREEIARALEKAWRWLERNGLILPNLLGAGGSQVKLSDDVFELARDPQRAALLLRTDSINLPMSRAPAAAALGAKLKSVDMRSVEIEMARALGSVDRDPEDALTAASSILEAVCHSLLEASGRERQSFKDTRSLLNAVHDLLDIRPIDAATADVRQILGGLNSVVLGVGALRTHAGDAHGRSAEQAPTPPRYARLSINAACAAALFLIETWESRQST